VPHTHQVLDVPEIVTAQRLFGDPDFLLRVVTADLAAHQRLRDDKLAALPGVQRLTSTLVTKDIVDRGLMGLCGVVVGAAGAAGALAGGTLTEALGWDSTLLVNVPIGLVLVVAVGRTVSENRGPARHAAATASAR
jgi:MFS family permease